MQIGAGTLSISMENPQKTLKINLPDDSVISLLGICPKDLIFYSIDTYSVMITDALFKKTRK